MRTVDLRDLAAEEEASRVRGPTSILRVIVEKEAREGGRRPRSFAWGGPRKPASDPVPPIPPRGPMTPLG
jgi:hypothetical protein